jgi:16S rRNA (cytidine1402-2'-O)-methyltransferase
MPATLFLVATPIGNLEDLSFRALRVLKEVSLIAAEDTRHTARLLSHYDIRTPTTSFHEHNEHQKVPTLVARLAAGDDVALVSDAGTPAVSDPGYRLVKAAVEAGFRVEAIPGPSAILAALVASGLPTDAFTFLGFPPARDKARRNWLAALRDEPRTLVFFEAPHRIRATLAAAGELLGDRHVVVARELTKLHEEYLRGPISAVLAALAEPRGEMTVILAPAPAAEGTAAAPNDVDILAEFERMAEIHAGRREAIGAVAATFNLRPREVYAAIERGKK